MRVTQEPQDEFKVNEKVVVTFGFKEVQKSCPIYQFAVIEGGRQIGNLDFVRLDADEFQGEYYLFEYVEDSDHLILYGTYDKRPPYEEIKKKAISIISGGTEPLQDIEGVSSYLTRRMFLFR